MNGSSYTGYNTDKKFVLSKGNKYYLHFAVIKNMSQYPSTYSDFAINSVSYTSVLDNKLNVGVVPSTTGTDKIISHPIKTSEFALDESKDEELRYIGSNANNYVNFNNELWRIIGVFKVEDENENYSNINPLFLPKRRLKIGTFKVISNGFRLGERFVKIIFDNALKNHVQEIYVTIYDKRPEQRRLIDLLEQWGFVLWGTKGEGELVYVRDFSPKFDIENLKACFPYISKGKNAYIVPIYPEYHTELLPDSILNTESPEEFIEDFPHRNCINKVYVSRAMEPYPGVGDILVFYRTGGYYKSVVTTVGEVLEVKTDFQDENDFILYCRKKSVYPEQALREMWRYSTRKPFVVNFLYAYSFPHRINMKELIDLKVLTGINDAPRGFKPITKEQFEIILKETRSDESFIID